ncbi:MAG: N-acetylmuramoyl-L-alanine amidase [Defluviitaleaceae bacterium]|nr:N-acetylmuramoyl-L-alanine amidase [Defluviitaleaceae bacterium]
MREIRRRRRPAPKKRKISWPAFIALAALAAALLYFGTTAVALDNGIFGVFGAGAYGDDIGQPGGFARPQNPRVEIDISEINIYKDHWRRQYRFYYDNPEMMNRDQHIVSDNYGFVRNITYSGGVLTINTYAPAVFEAVYDEQTGIVTIHVESPRERYDWVVIIDAGHGGFDPGAIHGGHNESDIVLSIAHKTYQIFAYSNSGVRAFLTRYDDSFLAMSYRTIIGNLSADLFVAIHANAYGRVPAVRGTEVLYARYSAKNRYGNPGRADISNADFSQIMQNHLVGALNTRDRGIVRRGDLAMLNASTIPLAYLEIEFMTNPQALADLLNPDFQQRTAQAIYDGVLSTLRR